MFGGKLIIYRLLSQIPAYALIVLILSSSAWAQEGPFPPAAEQEGSTAIHMDDERFAAWATGWTNFVQGAHLDAGWTDVTRALGPPTGDIGDVVSLGRGGQLTLTFDAPIVNGPGFDFAVFGNSFNDHFLELAYVEVSSDGANFVRFPNTYLGTNEVPFWGAQMDPTLIDGLAGKYRVGYGMPFDLEELAGAEGLDIHDVRYVRLVDIIGDGTYVDSQGNIIYDPYPTEGSAGFDLEALGVIHEWTPLHAWRVEHFGEEAYAENAANEADWSGDGVPNLLAYALGLDPTNQHQDPLFSVVRENHAHDNGLAFEYTRRAGYTNIQATLTPSLSANTWTNGPLTLTQTVIEVDEDRERVRVRPEGPLTNEASLFFRLEVRDP